METNIIHNIACEIGLANLPNDCIDLTVTSPPYDNLRVYNGFTWNFETVAKELFRVTKVGGVVVWIVGDATINGSETGTSFKQALFFMECGFNLHDTMIYSAKKPPLTHNRYEPSFEYMFVFSKGKPKTFNPILRDNLSFGNKKGFASTSASLKELNSSQGKKLGKKYIANNIMTIKNNIWHYKVGNNQSSKDKIAFEHPAIFPEKLVYDHIISWSNENDLVLDCFMGSGTTAKVASILNRNFIGFEISKEYCELAEKRLAQNTNLFTNE
jgi:DNA modification methylase